jgi:hypothetical protein
MDAKIPPVAGERCLRFKLRPAVRVLVSYSVVSVTAVANSSSSCTRNDHVGEPEQFNVMLRTAWLFQICIDVVELVENILQVTRI